MDVKGKTQGMIHITFFPDIENCNNLLPHFQKSLRIL